MFITTGADRDIRAQVLYLAAQRIIAIHFPAAFLDANHCFNLQQLGHGFRREAHPPGGVMRLEQKHRHTRHGVRDGAVMQHGHCGCMRQREGIGQKNHDGIGTRGTCFARFLCRFQG